MQLDQIERSRAILNDLIRYTSQPEELVKQRCKYSVYELAYLWPQYKDNPEQFYKDTDLYLFDLTLYQSLLVPTLNHMIDAAKIHKMKKVLDLGGGIGEYTIRFTQEADADVTYLDFLSSKTAAYAAFRFGTSGIDMPNMVNTDYPWHEEPWDAVIAMDVIEHMTQEVAYKTMDHLRKHVKYVFCNPADAHYNENYPQHITRYTMEGFEKIDINLYQNKAL